MSATVVIDKSWYDRIFKNLDGFLLENDYDENVSAQLDFCTRFCSYSRETQRFWYVYVGLSCGVCYSYSGQIFSLQPSPYRYEREEFYDPISNRAPKPDFSLPRHFLLYNCTIPAQ